jgi:hypothetical protein
MLGEAGVAAVTVDTMVRNAKLAFLESMLRGAAPEDGWQIAATAAERTALQEEPLQPTRCCTRRAAERTFYGVRFRQPTPGEARPEAVTQWPAATAEMSCPTASPRRCPHRQAATDASCQQSFTARSQLS